jgi:hypothetical protein
MTPTLERRAHGDHIDSEALTRDRHGQIIRQRHRVCQECYLDTYYLRAALNEAEYLAGMKFRRAYLRAILKIKVSSPCSGGAVDYELAQLTPLYSEELLRAAYRVLSPAQRTIVISVCGHDDGAGITARVRTLQRALRILALLWPLG